MLERRQSVQQTTFHSDIVFTDAQMVRTLNVEVHEQ